MHHPKNGVSGPGSTRSGKSPTGAGFSLLELAMVLLVIGLVLAFGSVTLPWADDAWVRETTRRGMTEAAAAVLAFSLTNHRLPCPANPSLNQGDAGFGTEDCTREVGALPHEALRLSASALDPFHRPIAYAVYRNRAIQADLAVLTELFSGLDEPTPVLNAQDFCRALRNGNPTTGSNLASTSVSTTTGGCSAAPVVNEAFLLASAGLEDADGDGDPFDGDNAAVPPTCFASPDQGRGARYDDLVLAVSFSALSGRVCS